jgi:hypothetical protein
MRNRSSEASSYRPRRGFFLLTEGVATMDSEHDMGDGDMGRQRKRIVKIMKRDHGKSRTKFEEER